MRWDDLKERTRAQTDGENNNNINLSKCEAAAVLRLLGIYREDAAEAREVFFEGRARLGMKAARELVFRVVPFPLPGQGPLMGAADWPPTSQAESR